MCTDTQTSTRWSKEVKITPALAGVGDLSESLDTSLPGLRAATTAVSVPGNSCRARLWIPGTMSLFILIAIPL